MMVQGPPVPVTGSDHPQAAVVAAESQLDVWISVVLPDVHCYHGEGVKREER